MAKKIIVISTVSGLIYMLPRIILYVKVAYGDGPEPDTSSNMKHAVPTFKSLWVVARLITGRGETGRADFATGQDDTCRLSRLTGRDRTKSRWTQLQGTGRDSRTRNATGNEVMSRNDVPGPVQDGYEMDRIIGPVETIQYQRWFAYGYSIVKNAQINNVTNNMSVFAMINLVL